MKYYIPVPSETMQSAEFRARMYCSAASQQTRDNRQIAGPGHFPEKYDWCEKSPNCRDCMLNTKRWDNDRRAAFLDWEGGGKLVQTTLF